MTSYHGLIKISCKISKNIVNMINLKINSQNLT